MNIIYTKSIIKPKELSDGTRISIMSRHTLNDGKTPDERIIEGITFDEWIKDFAPPLKLIGSYYRNEVNWKEFEIKYLEFLRTDNLKLKIKLFSERYKTETITLMCIEDEAEFCHRRLFAEELKKYNSDLIIIHK